MKTRLALFCAASVLCNSSALAGGARGASDAEHIQIQLTSFAISPRHIVLERGRRYVFDIENASGSSHDFTSRDFFASSELDDQGRATVRKGEIELKGHQSASVTLVPDHSGSFEFHCGHLMHAMLGMKGAIEVH